MIVSIILEFLFFGIVIVAVCFLFFLWLNSKSASIDDKFYEDNFDAGDMVEKYKVTDEDKN